MGDHPATTDASASPAASGDTRLNLLPALMSLARSSRQLMSLKLTDIGIVIGQDHLLTVLNSERGLNVGSVAASINVRPSTVSKMVDRLAENGLVVRESSAEDSRQTLIRLTSAGEQARREVETLWDSLENDLKCSLPKETSQDALRVSLGTIADVLHKRLMRLR